MIACNVNRTLYGPTRAALADRVWQAQWSLFVKLQQVISLIHKLSCATPSTLGQCRHVPAPVAAALKLAPPLPPASLMALLLASPRWRRRRRCHCAPGHPLRRGRWRAAAGAPPPCCLQTHATHCEMHFKRSPFNVRQQLLQTLAANGISFMPRRMLRCCNRRWGSG